MQTMTSLKRYCCAALAAATMTAALPAASALNNISDWAQGEVERAQTAGLIPETFAALSAGGDITRAEFCAVAVRLYESSTGKTAPQPEKQPFSDCQDKQVAAANALGLVSGKGNGTFAPNSPVTRQEMCVMLGNVRRVLADGGEVSLNGALDLYQDKYAVDDWAAKDMAYMAGHGVITGAAQQDGAMKLLPQATASREQSLMMAVRFLENCGLRDVYGVVDPESGAITPQVPANNGKTDAAAKPQTDEPISEPETPEVSVPADSSTPDEPSDHSDNDDMQDAVLADEKDIPMPQDELLDGSYDPELFLSPITPSEAKALIEEGKEALVFGSSGRGYNTQAQAEAAMADITVPVWRLQKDGTKVAGTVNLTVNAALAELYEAIFEEIFEGPEQFPIKDAGSYSWRSNARSEHRWGTAIDINWDENMECNIDKNGNVTRITTGSCWEPGENPYSIPADGDVVRAFKNHGFAWGGDAWTSKRDYMHFSYFGR